MNIRTLIACAVLFGAQVAQGDTIHMDARALLANPGFTVLDLRENNGRSLGKLDRASVQRLVDVTARLAQAFAMQPPEVVLYTGISPDASAESRNGRVRLLVNVAMLNLVGGSDDGVAAVASHVMAHVKASHWRSEFSRAQEDEADQLAVRAMADAGYRPQAEVSFYELMAAHPKMWWNDAHPPYPGRDASIASAVTAVRAK